ncbi:hypothetical protein [Ekhidna sp.]|uniref:hypothetical protein n=1 Tax=Ekhidna sp. TaxID=2608089 RepID=UPI003CCB7AE8
MKESPKYPFEQNVLLLACSLGLLRSILAVIGDFMEPSPSADLITDILFTLVFIYGLLATKYKLSFRWILMLFYIPLTGLFIYTFHQANGLQEGIENNTFVGLIFINFTLRGKLPVYFSALLIGGVLVSLFIIMKTNPVFINNHTNDLNFIFSSFGIIGITFYAKHVFTKRRNTLKRNQKELENKSTLLQKNQDNLIQQKKALEELALILDDKVTKKTKALNNQKAKREKFLSLMSNDLIKSVDESMNLVETLKSKTKNQPLIDMLVKSGNSLKVQIENLNKKVDGVR